MEIIPQKAIFQMRQSLQDMDISPAAKAKISLLLDRIEAKEGMAPGELKELSKILEGQEKQIKKDIALAKMARKATDRFTKKTDKIFRDYLTALKR